MRRACLLLACLLALPALAADVPLGIGMIEVPAEPTGSCTDSSAPAQWVRGSGTFCYCNAGTWACYTITGGGGGISDGDKGDVTVSGGGASWSVDSGAVAFQRAGALPPMHRSRTRSRSPWPRPRRP